MMICFRQLTHLYRKLSALGCQRRVRQKENNHVPFGRFLSAFLLLFLAMHRFLPPVFPPWNESTVWRLRMVSIAFDVLEQTARTARTLRWFAKGLFRVVSRDISEGISSKGAPRGPLAKALLAGIKRPRCPNININETIPSRNIYWPNFSAFSLL